MKSIRGTWGCLALALAAMGGCTDSGSRADAPTLLGQQRSAVAVGAPELVRDLRPAASKNPPSDPGSFAVMGGTVFFNAGDTLHGRELWASDETGGTRLVRDILPGGRDSHPGGFAAVGELIIFSAVEEDGTTRQLWRSDGTAEGTRRITNMAGGFQVWEQLVVGETLFLSVVDGAGDVELWKSDGTSEGTLRVKDLWPGGSSSPVLMQDVGGTLYFAANDGVTGFELWKSDGTPQGTVQVMDITPGAASTFLGRELVVMGGTLYFTAAHPTENGVELWKTDGTVEGTRRVKDIWPGPEGSALMYLTVLGDVLYFIADDGVWGRELWRSDGTEEGTRRVKDILPGSSASEPYGFHVVDGVLYFSARTWDFGRELWRSDGTEAGTWRVTDIEPGERDSLRSTPVRAGSRLYFFGIRSSGGYQLWRYDTKTGDTAQLHSYSPVVWYGTPPWDTASAGDTLYFFADDGRGVEPWKTDGTPEGTVLLEDIHTDNGHSAPRNLVDLGGTVLFSVSGAGSDALWKSDGTAAGTSLLRDGFAALWSSHEVVGGVVFFPARTAEAGVELWRSDGTPAGTWLVKDINPGPTGSDIQLLGQAGGKLLFSAWSGGFRLWASDGTPEGTGVLKDMQPSFLPRDKATVGGTLYFAAYEPVKGYELWKSNGTSAGTVLVADLQPGTWGSNVGELRNLNGTLVFAAITTESSPNRALWRLDATGRPQPVFVSARGVSGLAPEQFTVVGRNLFFFTDVASGTPALWRYDGKSSSAALVSRGRFHNVQDYVTSSGNALYFRAYDAEHGFEMWRSDGTDEGTRVLKDVLPGPESGMPGEYPDYPVGLPSHGLVLFRAGDPVRGLELWVSDGTEAGTHPVADLGRGTRSSDPHAFTRIGEYVYLSADDGTHGAELWRFTLPPPGDLTPPVVTCPATVWAEATSAEGGLVTLPAAKATDEGPTPPVVTYSPASGSLFPMGMTLVTAAARDAAGNVEVCSFEVWVRDSTPPVLTCPANKVVEATSPAGASVSYPPIPVSDNMTPSSSMSVTYSHPSGTTFPLGTTSPGAWAFDAMGNFGYCVFTITVKDTTGPTLTCPADVVVEALGPTGARAAYGTATASDAVSSPVSVVYSQASDSEFPVGTTRVTVTAKDKLANASSCSFGVTVRDSTAPVVTCPEPLTLEATDATGAIASFPEATAMDSVTGSPEVTYSHAPGSTFPVGDTTVTATATDVAGNTARCTFGVTVRDTTPPSLTCPADVEVEARDDASARPVEYPAATVGDAGMGAPRVVYSRASGSDFPVGTTPVDVTATDGMGNRASCSFRVTVKPPPKPDTGGDAGGDEDEDEEEDKGGGLGCASTGSSSMGLWGALTLLSWLASWRPRARRR